MRKKLLSLLLVCPMLLSLAGPVRAAGTVPFTDISSRQWFYSYVRDLYNDGIIDGTSATTFSPTRTVTLGQTLKLILLTAGYAEQPRADGHWAGGYLRLAKKNDLLGSAASLSLNDPVTRQQIAEIAVRTMKLQRTGSGASPFSDTADQNALILYDHGVITGIENKAGKLVFNPGGQLTRSEISAIIWRLKQLKPVTVALNLTTPVALPETLPEAEPALPENAAAAAETAANPEPAQTAEPAKTEPVQTAEPAKTSEPAKTEPAQAADTASSELPDWLKPTDHTQTSSGTSAQASASGGKNAAGTAQAAQPAASAAESDMPEWLDISGGGAGFASRTAGEETDKSDQTASSGVSGREPDPENDWRDPEASSQTGPTRYLTFRGKQVPIVESLRQRPYQNDRFQYNAGGFLTYESPSYTSRIGIDVSAHQGEIDWAAVRAAGVDFALIRLGYRGYSLGGLVIDAQFYRNIQGALDNGIEVGVYFFSQALNAAEGAEEARFCLQAVRNYNLTYPIVFDWEPYASSVNARTKGLSDAKLTQAAASFCQTVRAGGYEPMVYANLTYFYLHFDLNQLKSYPFWLAQYNSRPAFYYDFRIWQYSSTGRVAGISGNVDLNIEFVPK